MDEKNQPLPFSTVTVKGTTIGTTTNLDGSFFLELPSQNVIVIFSFYGYESKEVLVDKETYIIQLFPSTFVLDDIIVKSTKDLRSETISVLDKKELIGIETSISSNTLSKKGISNVEDGLKKIVGVTFNNSKLNIRGLDDRYNQVTLNSIPLPSNNTDQKNINLNILPSSLVDNIKVKKSYSSNQWSNIAGAQINISSTNIRETFNISYRPSINSQTNIPNHSFSLQYGKEGKLGIYYGLNFIYRNLNQSGIIRLTNKQGNNVLNYSFIDKLSQFNPSSLLVLKYSKNNFNISNTSLFVTQLTNSNRETLGQHFDYYDNIKTIRITPTQHSLFTNQINTEYNLNRLNFNFTTSYSKVISGENNREQYVFLYDGKYRFNNIDKLDNHLFNNKNIEDRFNIDLKVKFTNKKLNHFLGYLNQITLNSFDYTQEYYDLSYINNTFEINPNNYTEYINNPNITKLIVNNPASKVDGYTMINGGFYKVDFISNKFDLSGGIRVENPLQLVTYKDQFSPTFIRQNKINNIEILPYINSKFKLSDKIQIKSATSITSIRPRFREVTPFIYTEVFAGTKIQGNPELNNSKVYNSDFTFEFFPTRSEVLALTFFGKYILDPIERVNIATASGRLETFQNSLNSTIYGLELEVKKNYKSIDLDYNLSLLKSNIHTPSNTNSSVVVTNINKPLQGSTPILSNLDIFHQITPNSNIGLVYNYIGKKLTSVGVFGLGDIYQTPQHLLNIVCNSKIKNVSISLRFNNILNTPIELTQSTDVGKVILNKFTTGITSSIGITWSLK